MPPCPSSSTNRYRPPRTLPISAKPTPLMPPAGEEASYRTTVARRLSARPRVAPARRGGLSRLVVQRPQPGAELALELRALQRERNRRLEPAHRRARVVASPLELVTVDRLLLHQGVDRIGQLELATRAAPRP